MALPNERHVHPMYRLGWRGPTHRHTLNFAKYLTGSVPEVPASADHMSRINSWASPTNYRFGTCGPTSVANLFIAWFMYALGEQVTVSDGAVYDLYRRSGNPSFDPNAMPDANGNVPGDNGVDTSLMLTEMESGGGLDITRDDRTVENHKIAAFGKLMGPDIIGALKNATALFGGAIIGVMLEIAQQHQTAAIPAVWTDIPSSGDWGGHDVFGGSYSGAQDNDEQVISWLRKVGVADGFIQSRATEIFVAVPDIALKSPPVAQGVDWSWLANDFQQLTGRQLDLSSLAHS